MMKVIITYAVYYCPLSNLQSLLGACGLAYNKISADYI